MELIVFELRANAVFQQMTPLKNQLIYAVRPHLIKYGSPTGTLALQILDTNGKVEAQSASMNISQIPGNYWHGYQEFQINAAVLANNDFRVALVGGGGYTFSETAYIGWCSGFDLGKYPGTYGNAKGSNSPLDLEIWGYEEQKRGFA